MCECEKCAERPLQSTQEEWKWCDSGVEFGFT